MTLLPGPYRQSLLLIRLASLLVPAAYRESWRAEWEAEVWYAWTSMRSRGETQAFVRSQLREFCKGSVADASWYRWNMFNREEAIRGLRNWARSPRFCLGVLMALIALLGLLSGSFRMTRDVLLRLPYGNADRIATVSQGGLSLAVRSGIPGRWAPLWRAQSRSLEGVATYLWREEPGSVVEAEVSENFFELLGTGAAQGRTFGRVDSNLCRDCAVLSYELWQSHYGGRPITSESRITAGNQRYRVIGVLDQRFWFLSRRIGVWTLAELRPNTRTGVVVRLSADSNVKAAQMEMDALVHEADDLPWGSLVNLSLVHERVHSVFISFALALGLASVIAVAGLRLRPPRFEKSGCSRALFFVCKTVFLLVAVLLAGLEFTRAASITMIGGTDLLTEPLSTWLFLMGSMGALSWSIYDQRRRCRVCLRRLGLAAHVGCPGCLLLNWAGTELVCIEGHGMLHVPEMLSSWRQAEQWTALDDSWLELFARK